MSGSAPADNPKVVDFSSASEKHRLEKDHQRREGKVELLKQRFEKALPGRKTPVKDYLKKKKARKKR